MSNMQNTVNRKVRRANRALQRSALRSAVYDEFKDTTQEYCDMYPEYTSRSRVLNTFANSIYSVKVYGYTDDFKKVAISRHDDKEIGDWDTIQKIKNDVFGKESWALEVYPKESELQNVANYRWIFVGSGEPIIGLNR